METSVQSIRSITLPRSPPLPASSSSSSSLSQEVSPSIPQSQSQSQPRKKPSPNQTTTPLPLPPLPFINGFNPMLINPMLMQNSLFPMQMPMNFNPMQMRNNYNQQQMNPLIPLSFKPIPFPGFMFPPTFPINNMFTKPMTTPMPMQSSTTHTQKKAKKEG